MFLTFASWVNGKIYYRYGMNCSSVTNTLITEVFTVTRKARQVGPPTFLYGELNEEKIEHVLYGETMMLVEIQSL